VKRAILLLVALVTLTLTTSLPALTQEGETLGADQYELGAEESQYEEQGVADAGCDWYWGYRWYTAGAWEWWCWDPEMGWWYASNEDGTKQFVRMNKPGSFISVQ
jgi:hypothetical protein